MLDRVTSLPIFIRNYSGACERPLKFAVYRPGRRTGASPNTAILLRAHVGPEKSPHSRRLACSSTSQRFRLPPKYREYSLGRRKLCEVEFLHDPLAQW